MIEGYLDALRCELELLAEPRPVDTLFLGGGTPTHLAPPQLVQLLALIARWFPLRANGEFSVEANPCDVNSERVAVLAEAGVNRLSLGAQSWNDKKLSVLERDHDADAILAAVQIARERIPSISMDLIFATPGETLDDWQRDLTSTLQLAPDHLSTYGLTYEKGAMFWNRLQRNELEPVSRRNPNA
jgi:oxygen-independent coproporphyrinogen III oxidase